MYVVILSLCIVAIAFVVQRFANHKIRTIAELASFLATKVADTVGPNDVWPGLLTCDAETYIL